MFPIGHTSQSPLESILFLFPQRCRIPRGHGNLLQSNGLIDQWSDQEIAPGFNLDSQIEQELDEADIFAFLFSNDFIASPECKKEWQRAKDLSDEGKVISRIPIIVRECPWQDFLGDDRVKALPDDGHAVSTFVDEDVAWKQVYDGIKRAIDEINKTLVPKKL